jgi:hypothetical protein
MDERGLSEVDLRAMMEEATGYSDDVAEGRFVVFASVRRRRWNIIVEPDPDDDVLVVVTAFPVE